MPEDIQVAKPEQITAPEGIDPKVELSDVGKTLAEQKAVGQAARDASAAAMKEWGDASRAATGGGGGTGTSSGERAARWVLRFNHASVPDYLRQLDGLGATIAFPTDGGKYRYFNDPSAPNPRSEVRGVDPGSQVFWINDDAATAANVCQHLRIPVAPFMVALLPKQLEGRMADLEKAYQGLAENEIASTQFEVVFRGGMYDVFVASQTRR